MGGLVLLVAFLLELVAIAAVASLGFLLPFVAFVQDIAVLALGIAVVAFWGAFMAPQAKHRFPQTVYYIVKAGIYSIAAFALYNHGYTVASVVFIIVSIVDEILATRYEV